MDINEFAQQFPERMKKLQEFVKPSDACKEIMGIEAQEFYKESFPKQGFTDENLKPWADVKRRDPNSNQYGKGVRATALILIDTTELKNAIYFAKTETGVRVYNEKLYARVHNFGGKAGKKAFQMIARPFIGPSRTMVKRIKAALLPRIKDIMQGN